MCLLTVNMSTKMKNKIFLLFLIFISFNLNAQKSKRINIGKAKADVLPTTTINGVTVSWGENSEYVKTRPQDKGKSFVYFSAHGKGCEQLVDSAIRLFTLENINRYETWYEMGSGVSYPGSEIMQHYKVCISYRRFNRP